MYRAQTGQKTLRQYITLLQNNISESEMVNEFVRFTNVNEISEYANTLTYLFDDLVDHILENRLHTTADIERRGDHGRDDDSSSTEFTTTSSESSSDQENESSDTIEFPRQREGRPIDDEDQSFMEALRRVFLLGSILNTSRNEVNRREENEDNLIIEEIVVDPAITDHNSEGGDESGVYFY